MATNRIKHWASQFSQAAPDKPKSSGNTPASIPPGFAFCPGHLPSVHSWQQEIYRLAYQRALAETQVPRHHRQLFAVWN